MKIVLEEIAMATDKEVLIKEFLKALHEDNAAIFAGAGLSAASGFVNWKGLLKEAADELELDIEKETDLISLAQYFFNKNGRQRLSQLVIDNFSAEAQLNENHRILAQLPIDTYWTTNYDRLIEKSLTDVGKNPDVKIKQSDFALLKPKRDAIVYKMHGDIERASETVLIKDEYEMFHENNQLFSIGLKGDLISKTFLFIGYSFEDPDLEYILSRIRVLMGQDGRNHYCFFRKVNRNQYNHLPKEEGDEKFRYDSIKQELKCADLERYHIKPVLVDKYEDITEILQTILQRYCRSKILISGSAVEYKQFVPDHNTAQMFIHTLSREMVKAGFKIASGFGLGVGSAVINGSLDYVYSTNKRKISDYLILRPFPQYATNGLELMDLWDQYRRDFISDVGCAVFIFGNKEVNGKVVDAGGVRKEFDIAVAQGIKVIPVGATGYMSKTLWEETITNYDKYYSDFPALKADFEFIGDASHNHHEIITRIIKIITALRAGR
uniref:NAD(+) hydrolase ThsA n=2 Tax=Cytobacillus dafuensis TaxID=1742359 RepID=THSA_CYTDA|nr:RecName: Full=NAD(+) hydrolase ThsA; Short=NADase ThsA; AltName: Full=Thoeris protein ThsA [Cytobacillus dafuensis]